MPDKVTTQKGTKDHTLTMVQDIMTRDVAACHTCTDAAAAAEIMWSRNCGALPVVENGGRVVGIVTDRDLFIGLGTRNRSAAELQVGEVMSHDTAVCTIGDALGQALATMARRQVQRLPVVDEAGNLVGILSLDDIVGHDTWNGVTKTDVLAAMKTIWARQVHDASARCAR